MYLHIEWLGSVMLLNNFWIIVSFTAVKSVRLVTTALKLFFVFLVTLWVGKSCKYIHGKLNSIGRFRKGHSVFFAVSEDQSQYNEIEEDTLEQESDYLDHEELSTTSSSYNSFDGTDGKPGLLSFYNRPYEAEEDAPVSGPQRNSKSLLWFVGPAVLVASFVFPSLYLRRILSTIFEDSLLTGELEHFQLL